MRAGQQGLRGGQARQRCHLSTNRPYLFPGGRACSRDEDELYVTASNKRRRRAGQERVWGTACIGDGSSAPSPVAVRTLLHHGQLTSRGNSPRNRWFESVSLQRQSPECAYDIVFFDEFARAAGWTERLSLENPELRPPG